MNFLVAQLLIVLVVGVFGGCLVWVGFVGGFFFSPPRDFHSSGNFVLEENQMLAFF